MRYVVVGFLIIWCAVARAEKADEAIGQYVVDGEADAAAPEPRTAAVDEAFGRAVAKELERLVGDDARKANKAALDREILGHARLWVAKYHVESDKTNDGRRQLTVTVSVDRDKMRLRLGELKIPLAGEQPLGTGVVRTAVVLLRVVDTGGIRASYGAGGDRDTPGLAALSGALHTGGLALRRAPTVGAVRAGGELPLDDDEAEAIATDASVDGSVVANVTVGAPVAARGVAQPAVLVTARVRLVAHPKPNTKGPYIAGDGSASVAARVASGDAAALADAIDRALVAAAGDVVLPALPTVGGGQAFKGDDVPVAEAGIVMIRVAAKTPYALVASELKYLAGAKGVSRAVLRRVSVNGWVIGVSTAESAERIAQIARKAPANNVTATARLAGNLVELALEESPP